MSVTVKMSLPADMIALPGDAFVAEAVRRLNLSQISAREQHALAQTIYRGVNKSRIWEALSARSENRPTQSAPRLMTALVRPDDEVAVEEVLIDHADDDDAIFIEYAYFRLVGRDPELAERMQLQVALAEGQIDRHQAVQSIIEVARAEGRDPMVARMSSDQPFALISAERHERLVLVKRLSAREYLVAEGALHGASLEEEGLKLFGGLALAGPKRALKPGLWRLKLDWGQDVDAAILVEVTANAGAETILQVGFSGTTLCNLEFRVQPEHLISEVLVHGLRKGQEEDWIVRPREISLSWVGE